MSGGNVITPNGMMPSPEMIAQSMRMSVLELVLRGDVAQELAIDDPHRFVEVVAVVETYVKDGGTPLASVPTTEPIPDHVRTE